MSAAYFGYYDNWRTEILTCPKCRWTGTFEQGAVEYYRDLMDSSCPSTDCPDAPILAIVTYPTTDESERNLHLLSESDKTDLDRRKAFLAEFNASKLTSPEDLPDLPDTSLVLTWDHQGARTVIKHEDRIIWSEVALYEGADRFAEVALILKQKYGDRLADLVPTDASKTYLYGDSLRAPDTVQEARASLRP